MDSEERHFFCLSNNFVHKTKKQLDNRRNMIYNKIVIRIYMEKG